MSWSEAKRGPFPPLPALVLDSPRLTGWHWNTSLPDSDVVILVRRTVPAACFAWGVLAHVWTQVRAWNTNGGGVGVKYTLSVLCPAGTWKNGTITANHDCATAHMRSAKGARGGANAMTCASLLLAAAASGTEAPGESKMMLCALCAVIGSLSLIRMSGDFTRRLRPSRA